MLLCLKTYIEQATLSRDWHNDEKNHHAEVIEIDPLHRERSGRIVTFNFAIECPDCKELFSRSLDELAQIN